MVVHEHVRAHHNAAERRGGVEDVQHPALDGVVHQERLVRDPGHDVVVRVVLRLDPVLSCHDGLPFVWLFAVRPTGRQVNDTISKGKNCKSTVKVL